MNDRFNGISCFSGIGGLDLALQEDVRTVCYIEWDGYCQEVLKKRAQEGWLDVAPIWDNITTFDGRFWKGRCDIIYGGFPCQDISQAGKGKGIVKGETRSGLFYEMVRLATEIRPCLLFLENVSAITRRGFDIVLGELYKAGYDAEWLTLSASQVGAPHRRERWFCLAWDSNCNHEDALREIQERRWLRENAKSCGICRGDVSNSINNSDNTKEWPFRKAEGLQRVDRQALGSWVFGGTDTNVADSELFGCVHGQPQEQSAKGGEPTFCESKPEGNVAYSQTQGIHGKQGKYRGSKKEDGLWDDEPNSSSISYSKSKGGEQWSHREQEPDSSDEKGLFGCNYLRAGTWRTDPAESEPTSESFVGRVAHGVPKRVDRLKCLGNAVVPLQGRTAWKMLTNQILVKREVSDV